MKMMKIWVGKDTLLSFKETLAPLPNSSQPRNKKKARKKEEEIWVSKDTLLSFKETVAPLPNYSWPQN